MEVLVVGQEQVRQLLPMCECIETMADALATLARGAGVNPLRTGLFLPEGQGLLGMMPGYIGPGEGGEPAAVGIKAVTVFPGNHGTEYDSHQGAVLLFDTDNGCLRAVVDASEVTAIRTAAVSGVATGLLARGDAHDLAILGSGVQARTHLEAMLAVRPIDRVRVWSRAPDNALRFAERESRRHGIIVETCSLPTEAVAGADLICTTTSSPDVVLAGTWIAAGAHVNAVGSSVRTARELDAAAFARSSLFVDRRESTFNESGDFLMARAEGVVDEDDVRAEVGELLVGHATGRSSPEEITLFKSLGLAVEDVAAARYVYARAVELGVGTSVEFTGP